MSRRYILLDRDGTLIVEKHYLATVDGIEILPGAFEGLRELQAAGYGLLVISNQSGIARGKLTVETLRAIHIELDRRLRLAGIHLDAFYYCPHGPAEGCACRKPRTGMGLRAAAEFGFDLASSFMIGDKSADIEFGKACGARTILVRTGYGRETEATHVSADFVAGDLLAAARYILA